MQDWRVFGVKSSRSRAREGAESAKVPQTERMRRRVGRLRVGYETQARTKAEGGQDGFPRLHINHLVEDGRRAEDDCFDSLDLPAMAGSIYRPRRQILPADFPKARCRDTMGIPNEIIPNIRSAVLSRDLNHRVPTLTHAKGIYYHTVCGRSIVDACGGSAVACLGHGNARVRTAVSEQMGKVPYCHSQFFTTRASERLADAVIRSTDGKMSRLLTVSSGSEALEAALKIARQYFLELPEPQPQRRHFIARAPSYHGATLSALEVGGHLSRRAMFEPMLASKTERVSLCNTYRGMRPGETSEEYVARLAHELDTAFSRFPPNSVCAFVAETVTGASTGTIPAADGYFAAMKKVCEKHGALLILDEVMCGIGRTGTMHAWQQEDVVPNIQVVGKAFGGGFVPVSGVLIDKQVDHVIEHGSGKISHGQSFQAHPSACAAALEVHSIILEEGLLANVKAMGDRLSGTLQERIGSHPHVGDIRGRGLFWSVEFVRDKATRESLPRDWNVGYAFHEFAMQEPYNICVYPGNGTADGVVGDHTLIAPAYNVTATEIDTIVDRLARAVTDFFEGLTGARTLEKIRQW